MTRSQARDVSLLVFANLLFAAGWPALKAAQDVMGPVALNLWTVGISIPALYPYFRREHLRGQAFRTRFTARTWFHLFLFGFTGQTLATLLYAWGTGLSLAANGALIATCVPVTVGILAVLLLGERCTLVRAGGFLLALAGALVMSGGDIRQAQLFGPYGFGNLLIAAGCMANAIYIVYGKKLLDGMGPMTLVFFGQIIAFFGSIPFTAFEPFPFRAALHYSPQVYLSLAVVGLCNYCWALALFYRVLDRMDATQVALFAYLQPIFGVALAALLLGEKITAGMLIGGVLVIAATVLVSFFDRSAGQHPGDPLDGAARPAEGE